MTVVERFRLDGRAAIVTGASSGLGVAIAIALAEAGANVVVGARRLDRLAATQRAIEAVGASALAVGADVTKPSDCRALVEQAANHYGRVDILVNNAGISTAVPTSSETPEEFDEVIRVNLHGSYWMAQACGRVMGRGSSITNISSVIGLTTGWLPQASYSSSKAGILGLTRDLAGQWSGRKGIRVNAIAPGYFPTEMTDAFRPEHAQKTTERILLGRWGEPEELAATVVFLASDAASYITGQVLVVDGGFTIG